MNSGNASIDIAEAKYFGSKSNDIEIDLSTLGLCSATQLNDYSFPKSHREISNTFMPSYWYAS